jgi:ADP-ribose pyrophosphatase YjhB (NUDIX family)
VCAGYAGAESMNTKIQQSKKAKVIMQQPIERFRYEGKDMRTERLAPVILVYLIGYIAEIPHVLLVRRSANVGWMKNCWSVIAGFINNHMDLDRQALIEIAGETSLLQGEVSIPEYIDAFEDKDPGADKTWQRHLMASLIFKQASDSDGLGVRLDWEHTEGVWVPVSVILNWVDGKSPEDPVAKAILQDEDQVPDFKLNFERMRKRLEALLAPQP